MTAILRPVAFLLIVALIVWVLATAFAASNTGAKNPTPDPCYDFEDRQEQAIIDTGWRLLTDFRDYPILGDPKVQLALLASRGIAGSEAYKFMSNAAYIHSTVRELNQGYCWNAQNSKTLEILNTLRQVFTDWK